MVRVVVNWGIGRHSMRSKGVVGRHGIWEIYSTLVALSVVRMSPGVFELTLNGPTNLGHSLRALPLGRFRFLVER